jgi:thioredoxin-like negative regulator of GroEL
VIKIGNFDEAQRHLDALKRVFTLREEGWTLQGILAMQRQEFSEAKQAFEQALAIVGESKKAQMGLGMAYLGLGQSAEAWNIFEEVVSGDPDNVEAMRCLMQAGTVLQRWEFLSDRLARFVERNPADCDMRFALASVAFRAGHSQEAMEQLAWLRLMTPDYEGLEDLEGRLYPTLTHGNLVSTC